MAEINLENMYEILPDPSEKGHHTGRKRATRIFMRPAHRARSGTWYYLGLSPQGRRAGWTMPSAKSPTGPFE